MTKAKRSEAKMTAEKLARIDGWVGVESNGWQRTWHKGASKEAAFFLAKENNYQSCRPYQLTRDGYLIQV